MGARRLGLAARRTDQRHGAGQTTARDHIHHRQAAETESRHEKEDRGEEEGRREKESCGEKGGEEKNGQEEVALRLPKKGASFSMRPFLFTIHRRADEEQSDVILPTALRTLRPLLMARVELRKRFHQKTFQSLNIQICSKHSNFKPKLAQIPNSWQWPNISVRIPNMRITI